MLDSFYEKLDGWIISEEYKEKVLKEKELRIKLNEFLSKFNLDYIEKMSIDDYVHGKQNRFSFCSYVENTLYDFCRIAGYGASQLFTIYYKEKKGDYSIYKEKPGQKVDYNKVFEEVRKSLIEIIKASINNDYVALANSKYLYPQFKNKIAYLYSIDTQIPINSQSDLDIIITLLDLEQNKNEDTAFKRKKIYDFYAKFVKPKYPKMTTFLFMNFIYSNAGYLIYLRGKEKPTIETSEIVDYEIKDISIDEVFELKRTGRGTARRVVYQPGSEESKKITGRKAEDIVVEYLNRHKKQMNIKEIHTWCFGENQDDGKGYDISYNTNDGNEFFIEVKATKADLKDNVYFEMSDNELSVMSANKDNYYVYFVNNVNKGKVIRRILGAEICERKCLQPIKYRVNFSGKEKLDIISKD